ncbi:response regulator [Flavitalea antarctica]
MAHRILLIDDDSDDREMFCEAIGELSPDVICYFATDGYKAFSKLQTGEFELPDLIFLDINMPLISGWDCLQKFKEHPGYRQIPVIMYSTSSNYFDIEKANNLGALLFFTKPSNFKVLTRNLSVVIRHLSDNTLSSLVADSLYLE